MGGIVTVLNTPFTAANEIDVEGLQRNVAIALEAGVSGVLVGGLAGEVACLSDAERLQILSVTREVVDGRVPIIGGAFGESPSERVGVATQLINNGCDGIMASVPFSDAHTFANQIHELADLRPAFLMVQDWDPDGAGIPVPVIVDLFETIPEFTWLKIEVIPAGPKYSEVLEQTGGRLKVAGGWAVMEMLDALDRGVHAFMPTGLHRVYTTLYAHYKNGHREDALRLFEQLLPILKISNQNLGVSIRFFKRLLYEQGVFATDRVRVPTPPLSADQQSEFDRAIRLALEIDDSEFTTPDRQ